MLHLSAVRPGKYLQRANDFSYYILNTIDFNILNAMNFNILNAI